MDNSNNSPVFVDSTLKVTAKEDIDMSKELAHENIDNSTIDELLSKQDAKKQQE